MSDKKRILFIEHNLRNEKLGIMYLSAALKNSGYHATLIQIDKEDLDEGIRDYKPDFVAFSIATGEHTYALQIAQKVKQQYRIPNIFGGPHCTFFPELAYETGVDFVVSGQGEQTIVDIVEGHVRPGFVKGTIANHPDTLAFPDRGIFYQYKEFRENPMKNVITSRACPYRCSYCFNHSYLALAKVNGETKKWFNRRSVENVTDEINEIRDQYSLGKVLFVDDNFIQEDAWTNDFLNVYSNQVGLPWMGSMRVNHLDEHLAARLFQSGLVMVNYALESADPEVQQRLLNRGHIRNSDIIRAINLFNQFGIRARMQNIIGLPLTNPLEDALNTLQFNVNHAVTDSWCSIFQPYPRTALGQYCIDHGFINGDQVSFCSESFFHDSRLNLPNKREIYALQKLWYFIVDGNIPLDLIQILIQGEFTKQIGDQLQELRFQCSRKKLYDIDDIDPATATDLQSRERWATSVPSHTGTAAQLDSPVRLAIKGLNLPNRFIEILIQVKFAAQELHHLARYLSGEQVCSPPMYTLDDETGKLADPNISIFRRGCADPIINDIRNMPEAHFMQGIAEIQKHLTLQSSYPQERHL